ncbi:hypothetical protein FI667_g9929, partial [Globisporangium splendens]
MPVQQEDRQQARADDDHRRLQVNPNLLQSPGAVRLRAERVKRRRESEADRERRDVREHRRHGRGVDVLLRVRRVNVAHEHDAHHAGQVLEHVRRDDGEHERRELPELVVHHWLGFIFVIGVGFDLEVLHRHMVLETWTRERKAVGARDDGQFVQIDVQIHVRVGSCLSHRRQQRRCLARGAGRHEWRVARSSSRCNLERERLRALETIRDWCGWISGSQTERAATVINWTSERMNARGKRRQEIRPLSQKCDAHQQIPSVS